MIDSQNQPRRCIPTLHVGLLTHQRGPTAGQDDLAERALQQDHFPEAFDYFGKLLEFEPVYQFGIALSREGLGRHAEAESTMARLAEAQPFGFPPAQIWMAKNLLAQHAPPANKQAESLLKQVIASSPQSVDAYALLALIAIDRDRLEEAEAILVSSPQPIPEVQLQVAQRYALRGELGKGAAMAATLRDVFKQRVEKHLRIEDRLHWAQAAALAGNLPEAHEVLRLGTVLHPPEIFAIELSKLYYEAACRLKNQPNSIAGRERFLTRGIAILARHKIRSQPFLLYQLHDALEEYTNAERE